MMWAWVESPWHAAPLLYWFCCLVWTHGTKRAKPGMAVTVAVPVGWPLQLLLEPLPGPHFDQCIQGQVKLCVWLVASWHSGSGCSLRILSVLRGCGSCLWDSKMAEAPKGLGLHWICLSKVTLPWNLETSGHLVLPLLTTTHQHPPTSHCCFCAPGITGWCPQEAECCGHLALLFFFWNLSHSPLLKTHGTHGEAFLSPVVGLPLLCTLCASKAVTSSWPLVTQGWKNDPQSESFSLTVAHTENDDISAAHNICEAGGDL